MKHAKPRERRNVAAVAVALGSTGAIPLALAGTASAAPVSAWDSIAQCESGGRWNLPYGDASSTGGLQIQQPTWNDYGGQAVASAPYLATKAQQIQIAEKILAAQGPGAWTCNARVGYPLSSTGPNSSHLKGGVDPGGVPAPPSRPHLPTDDMREGAAPTRYVPYTVVSGDTLYGITAKITGNKAKDNWRPTYAANQQVVGLDPDLIFPGQHLRVPNGKAAPPPPAPAARTDGKVVSGKASFFGGPGDAQPMACGGHTPPASQGVALWGVPCGTQVTITSRQTGKSVTAPVVDRGPGSGPIANGVVIDLLPGTWDALGVARSQGLQNVTYTTGTVAPPTILHTGGYFLPCNGQVSQVFHNPGAYTLGYHTGVDMSCANGSRVVAATSGVVVASDTSSAYGNNVQIRHADGKYTLYAHLSTKSVAPGQTVQGGQQIGTVGSTGTHSSGPHLHLELRVRPAFAAGNFLDPVAWLRSHGVNL